MKTESWLWPDHVIGKRESRRLRDEHNELVNVKVELAETLETIANSIAMVLASKKIPNKLVPGFGAIESEAREAIANAEKGME